MIQANNTGNGCTLEDCHTNLFALTDLVGIKWRKFCNSDNSYCVEPLDDPVLASFTRCIRSDILCVWRRVPKSSTDGTPSVQLTCHKELWVFWYGDEPLHMSSLLAPELQERDSGSWDNGLSYECRTLLFKALHNLIERCLMSQNFVRIGKWFVQPYPHYNTNACGIIDKSSHLSISFSFFLHGESTVCASIDVREHPPLRNLHPQHLAIAAQTPVPVILAPYGIAATLTGQSYRETDHGMQKFLDEWRQFYVLPDWDKVDGVSYLESGHVPPAVEVVVAGMRMKYPSCFVMLLADKEAELLHQHQNLPTSNVGSNVPTTPSHNTVSNISLTSPRSPCPLTTMAGDSPSKTRHTPISEYLFVPTLEPGLDPKESEMIGQRILQKSWQDSTVTSGVSINRHQQTEGAGASDETQTVSWEIGEPLWKNSCICPRMRGGKSRLAASGLNKPSIPNTNKHPKSEKSEKTERGEKVRHSRNVTPFHRRLGHNDGLFQQSMDVMMQQLPPTALANVKLATSSGQNIPQLHIRGNNSSSSGGGGANAVENSVDSPHSAAPSPLNISQIQPSVSQNGDPTMPTLSPHPPSKSSEKDLPTAGTLHGDVQQETNSASHGSGPGGGGGGGGGGTGGGGGPPGAVGPPPAGNLLSHPPNTNGFARPTQQNTAIKIENSVAAHIQDTVNGLDNMKVEGGNAWLDLQKERQTLNHGLKRPILPTQGYQDDEEELVIKALYNFDSIHNFLEQPIKRCRMDHDSYSHRSGPQQANSLPSIQKRPREKSPPQPQYDPYEFSDDSSSDPGNFSNRSFRNSRDENFARSSPFGNKQEEDYIRSDGYPTKSSLDLSPETPGTLGVLPVSLTREEDLKPKMNDLDNIFDTDSESSDPEPLPSTGNHLGSVDDQSRTAVSRTVNSSTAAVPTTNMSELTQMYPTPPSQEPQHTLSPGNMTELPPDQTMLDITATKLESVSHTIEEHKSNIQDWSFVYKPPVVCMYVGSPKYAPVDLPSNHGEPLTLPPELHYKPSWHQFPHLSIIDKTPQTAPGQYPNLPSVENIGSIGPKPPERMTSVETSPATFGPNSAQQRTPRTPMSYELQSPASNASSYMKNLSSVDNHPTNSQRPESHSLVVNVMLSDSVFNLFKDHNFDSCPMCVCNMNIKGTDIINYIPDKSPEPQYQCTCGFSAVVNRRYGSNSGLFYEDEVDITGVRSERLEQRKPSLAWLLNHDQQKDGKEQPDPGEEMPQELMVLLQGYFSSMYPSYLLQTKDELPKQSTISQESVNLMEIQDGCEACLAALEVGRQASDNCCSQRLDDSLHHSHQLLHRWPYLQNVRTPANSQDVVRLLKSLQPLLQDAIQKKRTTRLWESVYTILGPLSWKDFHLMAGRGSKETSEPQPVPPLLVGYDKDWLSLSPFALRYWDKMMLEPYGKPRDIAYVIIAPDNKYILSHVRTFFQELSRTYEASHLGKHRQFTKTLHDSIMRISQAFYNKVANESVNEWFANLGNSPLAAKLRQFTQVCTKYLAPFLARQNLDKSIFESPPVSRQTVNRPQTSSTDGSSSGMQSQVHTQSYYNQSSMSTSSGSCSQGNLSNSLGPHGPSNISSLSSSSGPSSSATESQASSSHTNSDDKENDHQGSSTKESAPDQDSEPSDSQMSCLVIYIVDPFTYCQDWDNMNRLSTLGLLRCYQDMLQALPEQLRQCTQLQIIPQQLIIDHQSTSRKQHLKNLCMSVYTQSRRLLTHTIPGRSLTGFGPAAAGEKVLKAKQEHHIGSVQLYTPPYILGNMKIPSKLTNLDHREHSAVMFCGYCLSEDQRWLLAVCTDSSGEILETCTINIDIPNRNRRKKASARRIGLQKLWDFIVAVLSQTSLTWRLVIGRLGRLGHGELKGWACLLTKKNLRDTSSRLREMCKQCELLSPSEQTSILSACLVSLEVHPTIHIMPDSLKMEERRSGNSQLSTPKDASCTHILVFPTSARAQATQENPPDSHIDGLHGADLDMSDELLKEDFLGGLDDDMTGIGAFTGIDDLLGGIDINMSDPIGSPQNTHLGSPGHGDMGGRNSMMVSDSGKPGGEGGMDIQEENITLLSQTLLQQPLAMGFYVSTAKTGPLPKWFWGQCPHREGVCPNCFKAALHIHCPSVQQNHDEFDHSAQKHSHPLDSSFTCDVLRYVLETYNALSWLTMDSATNDRRSCLPAHFVVLMQLYHAINNLV